jgi:hypothetical protein
MTVTCRAEALRLLVGALAVGCSVTSPRGESSGLDGADALARAGRYTDAREAYTLVIAERPASEDRALLGLARVALDPQNPEKDERQAAGYLDRLLAVHPQSRWAVEARTWRGLLRSVEQLQRDVRRRQQDLERLHRTRQDEQRETVRLRQEREQLRQIDVEFERPVRVSPTTSPAKVVE